MSAAQAVDATTTRRSALLVIIQALLLIAPIVILGSAIEWPASLDDPAEIALPRLAQNAAWVRLGYLIYLVYSVLFLPVAVIVARWLNGGGAWLSSTRMQVIVGLAATSALARAIGIIRWLSAMLPMAEQWGSANPAEQTILALQFEAVNNYGGAIGEILGVSILAAAWLAVTATGTWGDESHRWLKRSGVVVALLLLGPAVELLGVDAGPIVAVSSTGITFWLVAVGVAMFRSASRPALDGSAA